MCKDWADKKEEIMYKALKAKFSQNSDIRDMLLKTNDRMLVEDSPYDGYWGIGKDKKGSLTECCGLFMKYSKYSINQNKIIQTFAFVEEFHFLKYLILSL